MFTNVGFEILQSDILLKIECLQQLIYRFDMHGGHSIINQSLKQLFVLLKYQLRNLRWQCINQRLSS